MTPARSSCRGFTLMELIVTMVIGTIILFVAASILGRTGDSYEEIGGGVGAEREARAALTQLSEDLSSGVFHEDEVFSRIGSGWPIDKIGFFSLQPGNAQASEKNIGDLCAINYYVADVNLGGRTVRCLKRGFRNSVDTFNALKNSTVASLFQPDPILDEEIAFGVVSFEARPKYRDSESSQILDWTSEAAEFPEFVQLQLIIARPDLAGKLQSPDDWSNSRLLGVPTDAINTKGLEVYQTLIHFGNESTSR